MDPTTTVERHLQSERVIYVARVKRKDLSNPYPPRKSGRANPKDSWLERHIVQRLLGGKGTGMGWESFCSPSSGLSSHFSGYQTKRCGTGGSFSYFVLERHICTLHGREVSMHTY